MMLEGQHVECLSLRDTADVLSSVTCTTSLAKWLRRPYRERKIRRSILACVVGNFSGSNHTSDVKIGARCLALKGQRWDFLAQCQYSTSG